MSKILKSMNLRITVITVCRNSVDTIERTFTSVLNQHYLPYEYIVIDGASNDGTLGIILKYQQLFEAKNVLFQYVSEPDKGLYDAMNKALPYVTGDWVHYLNSDDFYYDNKTLYNMSLFLAKTQKDIVAGNMFISSENKRTKLCRPSIIPRKLAMLFTCPFQQPATFVKATLMKNTRFDTAYRNSADYKLWVQLILEGIQYEYVNVNVTVFNVGGASANLRNMNNENIRLFKEVQLSVGAVIHRCYIHMYLLYYLKQKFPSLHLLLKRLFS